MWGWERGQLALDPAGGGCFWTALGQTGVRRPGVHKNQIFQFWGMVGPQGLLESLGVVAL